MNIGDLLSAIGALIIWLSSLIITFRIWNSMPRLRQVKVDPQSLKTKQIKRSKKDLEAAIHKKDNKRDKSKEQQGKKYSLIQIPFKGHMEYANMHLIYLGATYIILITALFILVIPHKNLYIPLVIFILAYPLAKQYARSLLRDYNSYIDNLDTHLVNIKDAFAQRVERIDILYNTADYHKLDLANIKRFNWIACQMIFNSISTLVLLGYLLARLNNYLTAK